MSEGQDEHRSGADPPRRQAGAGELPVPAEEILESISDAFYAVDRNWRFTYVNQVAERWWGRPREDLLGRDYWAEFPQAVGSPPYEAHMLAARERRVVRLEAISPIVGHWVDISIFPHPHGLSVYFRDISERKREEARQHLLVNELNHRVKNTLATVQSIAAMSLKGDDIRQARARFTERLIALARANDLVVAESWQGARLRDLAAQVTSPHAGGADGARVTIDGPDMLLKPAAATALALALHELATNAAKYGALTTPAGSVSLRWRVEARGAESWLRLVWAEQGGPPVKPPVARGFGTRLLHEGLRTDLRADVELDFAPSGLVCTLEAPLADISA